MRYIMAAIILIGLMLSLSCEAEETTYRPFPTAEALITTKTTSAPATTSKTSALPQTTQATTPAQTTTPAQPETFTPIVLTGSSSSNTAPFLVTTDEWIVEWSYIPVSSDSGQLIFFIYPRGETVSYVESVWDADISGSTYSYAGPGEYYIKVIAANIESWTITILPPD